MNSDRKILIGNDIENIIKNIRASCKIFKLKNRKPGLSKVILFDYYNLITKNINNQSITIYLLHIISREINNSSSLLEKELLLSLLPEFYVPFFNSDISVTDKYLSRILTSIQSNILSEVSPIFIGEIFKRIIFYIFNNKEELNRVPVNKELFEICQGFCLFNMKQNQYNYQLSGIICLNLLLKELDYSFLNIKNYVSFIWEKINFFLNSEKFSPKEYLLKYLYDFIMKFNRQFKPYVNISIYKILGFIENKNSNIRKNSLNVLSLLINFYPSEIKPIKSSIIKLLTILQNDEDENIRNKSNYIFNKIQNKNTSKSISRSSNKKINFCFYDLDNNFDNYNKINEGKAQNSINNRIHNKRIVSRKPKQNNLNSLNNSIKINYEPIENEKYKRNSNITVETRQIFYKNETKNENKRYYGENTTSSLNYASENEGLGFRDLLTMVRKKSDKKCKMNNFSNLREEIRKNNHGLNQIRKIKSEKIIKIF